MFEKYLLQVRIPDQTGCKHWPTVFQVDLFFLYYVWFCLHFDTHFLTSKKKCRWVGGNGMKLLDFSFFLFSSRSLVVVAVVVVVTSARSSARLKLDEVINAEDGHGGLSGELNAFDFSLGGF